MRPRRRALIGVFAMVSVAATALWVARIKFDAARGPLGWVPVGFDSFYHAARARDAFANPLTLWTFDPLMFAPEGYRMHWPWGYDGFLASVGWVASQLDASADPVYWLLWVPAVLGVLNALLVAWLARTVGLSLYGQILASACFVLNPVFQGLHTFGALDHHAAEITLILLSLCAVLGWLKAPESRARAMAAGGALAAALAVHLELFVLQLPVVFAFALIWLSPRPQLGLRLSAPFFSTALLATTLLVCAIGGGLRAAEFSYVYASWFQPYAAALMAGFVLASVTVPRSAKTAALLTGALVVAILPGLALVPDALLFLSAGVSHVAAMGEAQSPLAMIQTSGARAVVGLYTCLPLFALAGAIILLLRLKRCENGTVATLFGYFLLAFGLALVQFRYIYFLLPIAAVLAVLAIQAWAQQNASKRAIGGALLALGLAPGVPWLLSPSMMAGDRFYESTASLYGPLRELCGAAPGRILATPNIGNFLRFHTGCGVMMSNIANSRDDAVLMERGFPLLTASPEELQKSALKPDYLIITRADGQLPGGDKPDTLFKRLFGGQSATGYTELMVLRAGSQPNDPVVVRVFALQ